MEVVRMDSTVRYPGRGWVGFAWMGIIFLFLALLIDASAQAGEVESCNGPTANALLNPPSSDGAPVKVTIALVLLNITDIDEVG